MPSTISCSSRMMCSSWTLAGAAEHLVQRQHRVVAGVIGVVAGRPVDDLAAVAQREVVGDRDRLVVGDQEAVLRARGRRPRAHPRVGARLQQVDRGAAAGLVLAAVRRHPFLVRAPAELGRLHALRQEALDRPGVDEDVHRLRALGALGVALGDVDALDADLLGEPAPVLAGLRLAELELEIARDVEQRLLDEPRHHARIGAAAGDRRRAARLAAPRRQHGFAQRIVRARLRPELGVEVEARPRLDHGVDVERADLAGELHDVERGGVDRQVDAKPLPAARGQQRRQQLAVILPGHRLVDEADAALVEQLAVLVLRIDDDEARLVEGEMALDQRQRAFADRAEADHHDGTVDAAVHGPLGHGSISKSRR